MSTDAISPLRQRMLEDMSARKLNPHTQRSHISSCKRFAAYLKRSPDTATADEIRLFQLHLTETKASKRPPRHAVARDARSAAAMVEGATGSLRYGRAARAALVVPWPQARKAGDDPARP